MYKTNAGQGWEKRGYVEKYRQKVDETGFEPGTFC